MSIIQMRYKIYVAAFLFLVTTSSVEAAPTSSASSEIGSESATFSKRSNNLARSNTPSEVQIQLPSEEEPVSAQVALQEFFVRHIKLEGAKEIPLNELQPILSKFENQNLNLVKLRTIAKNITQYYRLKGFITSRAFVPPQAIDNETVVIMVVEGKLGKVFVTGNKYVRTNWLQRYMVLKEGEVIQYNKILQGLIGMNSNPDRQVRAALAPGALPETSDVYLNVTEQRPYHFAYTVDDYGTKLTGRLRQGFLFQDTNLTGHDDMLFNALNVSDTGDFLGEAINYLLPVSPTGGHFIFSYSYSDVVLGKQYENLNIKGGANIEGVDYVQPLVNKLNWSLNLNSGLSIKEIWTTEENQVISKNHLTVIHFGPDLTRRDDEGTTTLKDDLVFGIPDFINSDNTQFFVDNIDFSRTQNFLWDSVILSRIDAQFTRDSLVSAQQFRLGGFDTVRGYDEGDSLGDYGFLQSTEWHIPPYFIPKDWLTPWQKESYWQAVQFVTFIDAGVVYVRHQENEARTLVGTGVGLRINLTKSFTGQIDCGWPVGDKPTDGRGAHLHFGVTVSF